MKHLAVSLILFGGLFSSTVWADEDCAEAARLTDQASTQTQLGARLENYRQARRLCPSDPKMHYRAGLSLMAVEQYDSAHTAFMDAMDRASQQNLPPAMRMEILGRLAENDYRSGNRPKALIGFKVAREFSQKHHVTLPDWLIALQKDLDQQLDQKPLSATEMQASLRSMRDLGVEASVDYRVLFEFDSDQPTEDGKQQLRQIASSLQQSDSRVIQVVGHTDVRGRNAYNQSLSERRAKRVVALIATEVPELKARLRASGKGMTQPKYLGNTEEDHQLNRRVEFVFEK